MGRKRSSFSVAPRETTERTRERTVIPVEDENVTPEPTMLRGVSDEVGANVDSLVVDDSDRGVTRARVMQRSARPQRSTVAAVGEAASGQAGPQGVLREGSVQSLSSVPRIPPRSDISGRDVPSGVSQMSLCGRRKWSRSMAAYHYVCRAVPATPIKVFWRGIRRRGDFGRVD